MAAAAAAPVAVATASPKRERLPPPPSSSTTETASAAAIVAVVLPQEIGGQDAIDFDPPPTEMVTVRVHDDSRASVGTGNSRGSVVSDDGDMRPMGIATATQPPSTRDGKKWRNGLAAVTGLCHGTATGHGQLPGTYKGDLHGLRCACAVATVLHTISAVVAFIVMRERWLLLITSTISIHPLAPGGSYLTESRSVLTLDARWTSRGLNAGAALCYAMLGMGVWTWYQRGIVRRRSTARSALQMIVTPFILTYMAAVAGISELFGLSAIALMTLSALVCILISETRASIPSPRPRSQVSVNVNDDDQMVVIGQRPAVDISTTYIGMFLLVVVWIIILFALALQTQYTGHNTIWTEVASVIHVVVSNIIITINAFLQQRGTGCWSEFVFGEKIAIYISSIYMFILVVLEVVGQQYGI